MLGLRAPSPSSLPILPPILHLQNPNFRSLSINLKNPQFKNPEQFRIYAQNGSNNEENKKNNNGLPTENGDEDGKVKNGIPKLNLKWMDLVLDPDPDNIVAVGLTGLLTWASVQVLWQLFLISAAILLAALKYTIVAVLLIFILITLL